MQVDIYSVFDTHVLLCLAKKGEGGLPNTGGELFTPAKKGEGGLPNTGGELFTPCDNTNRFMEFADTGRRTDHRDFTHDIDKAVQSVYRCMRLDLATNDE